MVTFLIALLWCTNYPFKLNNKDGSCSEGAKDIAKRVHEAVTQGYEL